MSSLDQYHTHIACGGNHLGTKIYAAYHGAGFLALARE